MVCDLCFDLCGEGVVDEPDADGDEDGAGEEDEPAAEARVEEEVCEELHVLDLVLLHAEDDPDEEESGPPREKRSENGRGFSLAERHDLGEEWSRRKKILFYLGEGLAAWQDDVVVEGEELIVDVLQVDDDAGVVGMQWCFVETTGVVVPIVEDDGAQPGDAFESGDGEFVSEVGGFAHGFAKVFEGVAVLDELVVGDEAGVPALTGGVVDFAERLELFFGDVAGHGVAEFGDGGVASLALHGLQEAVEEAVAAAGVEEGACSVGSFDFCGRFRQGEENDDDGRGGGEEAEHCEPE